jgi:hypothetical protein
MSTRHLAHLRENSRGDSPGRLGIWQGKDSSASLGKHILNHVSRYQGKKWYGRNTSRGVSWISPMRPYDYWLYIIRTRHELLGIIRGLCVVNVRTLGVVVLANRRTWTDMQLSWSIHAFCWITLIDAVAFRRTTSTDLFLTSWPFTCCGHAQSTGSTVPLPCAMRTFKHHQAQSASTCFPWCLDGYFKYLPNWQEESNNH